MQVQRAVPLMVRVVQAGQVVSPHSFNGKRPLETSYCLWVVFGTQRQTAEDATSSYFKWPEGQGGMDPIQSQMAIQPSIDTLSLALLM